MKLSGWGLETTMETLQLWIGDDNGDLAAAKWSWCCGLETTMQT